MQVTDFKPEATGRVLVVQYGNGEVYRFAQVGWVVVDDDEMGFRFIEPAVWDEDDRVRSAHEVLRVLPSGHTHEWIHEDQL